MLTVLLIIFLSLFCLVPAYATSNVTEYATSNLSDDQLLVNAYSWYGQNDWLKAALLFSAYLDRNPELLQSDSKRRENLDDLYDYAISRLKDGLEAAKTLPTVKQNLDQCQSDLKACKAGTTPFTKAEYPGMAIQPPPTPIPLPDTKYYQIQFKNNCSSTIWTALHYRNLSYQWVTNGWWEIGPGETASIAQTSSTYIYVYANNSDLEWTGDKYHDHIRESDKVYGFRESKITVALGDNWTYSFNCE